METSSPHLPQIQGQRSRAVPRLPRCMGVHQVEPPARGLPVAPPIRLRRNRLWRSDPRPGHEEAGPGFCLDARSLSPISLARLCICMYHTTTRRTWLCSSHYRVEPDEVSVKHTTCRRVTLHCGRGKASCQRLPFKHDLSKPPGPIVFHPCRTSTVDKKKGRIYTILL